MNQPVNFGSPREYPKWDTAQNNTATYCSICGILPVLSGACPHLTTTATFEVSLNNEGNHDCND